MILRGVFGPKRLRPDDAPHANAPHDQSARKGAFSLSRNIRHRPLFDENYRWSHAAREVYASEHGGLVSRWREGQYSAGADPAEAAAEDPSPAVASGDGPDAVGDDDVDDEGDGARWRVEESGDLGREPEVADDGGGVGYDESRGDGDLLFKNSFTRQRQWLERKHLSKWYGNGIHEVLLKRSYCKHCSVFT
ncbi:unnamed protein product [Calypogeia fissa]